MQMVYRAKDLHEAQGIRALLAKGGIVAHVADPASDLGPRVPGFIRVSVDNERLDAARRLIAAEQRAGRRLL